MKSTGILRCVDELGRIVIPKSMRVNLDIAERDQVEIFVEGERIILQKYDPSCVFCGSTHDILFYNGKRICKACLDSLKSL